MLGSLCVALAVVATIVWTLFSNPTRIEERPTMDNRPNTTSATPATGSTEVQREHAQKDACLDQTSDLGVRTVCFLKSWYLLRPDDTSESKRQRIAPYATSSFMREHSMVVTSSSEADKARIREMITVRASINPDSVVEPFDHDNPEEGMEVSTQVVIWSSNDNGKMIGNHHTVVVQTLWQKKHNTWKVIWLDELSDTG